MVETIVENEVRNELLFPSIKLKGSGIYVETGVFLGGNLIRVKDYVNSINSKMKIVGVDDFTFSNISIGHFQLVGLPPNLPTYIEHVQNNIQDKSIELISGDSISVLEKFNDDYIDIIFIDDNHEYSHVKKLLVTIMSKMKKDGIVTGHDWNSGGVYRAVTEHFGRQPDKVSSSNGGYLYYLGE